MGGITTVIHIISVLTVPVNTRQERGEIPISGEDFRFGT